jgi:hypothetical protein
LVARQRNNQQAKNGIKDIAQNDAKVTGYISNTVEAVADSISHKLHPIIEQYARLFAHSVRAPVCGARTKQAWNRKMFSFHYSTEFN